MMHAAVEKAFVSFTEPLEGRVPHMYLDVKRLITTGIGNLIDPIDAAVRVRGWKIDGRPATEREVREDWMALRAENDRRIRFGEIPLHRQHWKFAARYTRVRLDDAGIAELVIGKLRNNAAHLRAKHFPQWDSWPADAQLAVLSMAWACGPDFPLPKPNGSGFVNFAKYAKEQNWTSCVAACRIKEEGNPGVVPRNAANRHCFMNAAFVKTLGLPVDVLHWPGDAPDWSVTEEPNTRVDVPHPGPPPAPLAEPFSVADVIVRDALKGR
jgi:hypothetical protein